jgi:hypothetical protein
MRHGGASPMRGARALGVLTGARAAAERRRDSDGRRRWGASCRTRARE